MASSSSFSSFHDQTLTSALKCTKLSATLPQDINFHRTMDSQLAEELDTFSERVLSMTNRLLTLVDGRSKGKGKERLIETEDVVDRFGSLVVDEVDLLFERTDKCLDDYLGRSKEPAIEINPLVAKKLSKAKAKKNLDINAQNGSQLAKPQTKFKKPIDNSDTPWYPNIPHKYNAQVPLGYVEQDSNPGGTDIVMHPYRYEITHTPYPSAMFKTRTPVSPLPPQETPITYVSDASAFASMLESIRDAPEIALDIEHHSYRTYAGFVCLIQISTRKGDWIVDCLIPEIRELLDGGELGEILSNPKIVKVLHGADSDIIWLQQDFNLYIVNLFDTFHASKLLEFPRHGLANLLEMYCDFIPDKKYQLADWRIRPLTEDMLEYARSDTHFLLYIYDNLINALLDRQQSLARAQSPSSSSRSPRHSPGPPLIKQALSRSEETALRTYAKEPYDAENGTGTGGWDTLAKKWNKPALTNGPSTGMFMSMERETYKAIHAWRDKVAREEDESTRFILPNHHLFLLADRRPADPIALLKIFGGSDGGRNCPPVVRRRAAELARVIKAVAQESAESTTAADTTMNAVADKAETLKPDATPMNVDDTAEPESSPDELKPPNELPALGIWGQRPNLSSAARTSSLFGTTLLGSAPQSNVTSTTKSALFGSVLKSPPTKSNSLSNFQDVVARIHDALVIAPSAPKLPVTTTITMTAAASTSAAFQEATAHVDFAATGMQVEIPYVPPSQRTTKPSRDASAKMAEDTIVIVGQARQKRKRGAGGGASAAGEPPGSKKGKGKGKQKASGQDEVEDEGGNGAGETRDEDTKPFDFASVPNILDDVDEAENAEQQRKKKKARVKKSGNFKGDFPAPPRANNEVTGGSRSHTFKK